MFCSISGNVPEQPVVAAKSGLLFERRLVEKFVRETGKCPITSEPLALDELLPVKCSKTVKPRALPSTSVPGLLSTFHDEWDALMLETHTLRQGLHTVRQELSHALYQHDAACRVIARLMRERDDALAALEDAKAAVQAEQAATSKRGAEGEEGAGGAKRPKVAGIPESILQELMDINATLSKGRKKRALPPGLASPEDLAALVLARSAPLHKTTAGGIVAMDAHPAQPALLATAGLDATAKLYDTAAGRQLASLEGHGKRLTGVQWAGPSVILTSSADKTARVWREEGGSWWVARGRARARARAWGRRGSGAAGRASCACACGGARRRDLSPLAAAAGSKHTNKHAHVRACACAQELRGRAQGPPGGGGGRDAAPVPQVLCDGVGRRDVVLLRPGDGLVPEAGAAARPRRWWGGCGGPLVRTEAVRRCGEEGAPRLLRAPCAPLQVADESAKEAYTTVQFHPDGLILGTGARALRACERAACVLMGAAGRCAWWLVGRARRAPLLHRSLPMQRVRARCPHSRPSPTPLHTHARAPTQAPTRT